MGSVHMYVDFVLADGVEFSRWAINQSIKPRLGSWLPFPRRLELASWIWLRSAFLFSLFVFCCCCCCARPFFFVFVVVSRVLPFWFVVGVSFPSVLVGFADHFLLLDFQSPLSVQHPPPTVDYCSVQTPTRFRFSEF